MEVVKSKKNTEKNVLFQPHLYLEVIYHKFCK